MTDAPSPGPRTPVTPCDIAPYVPHRRGMCLLDRLLTVDDESLQAEITPRHDDLFATEAGIPGWVGLEWLAQAVAAWAGVQAVASGTEPHVGFLLGTRRYRCAVPHFAFARPVRVEIALDFRADNGLGAFRGQLTGPDGECLASCVLNVFQPESPDTLNAIQRGASL